jgi:folate-binding protein YgfZ
MPDERVRDATLLDRDAALVGLGGVEAIGVTGADRVSFLQRLTTGHVEGTPVGGGCRSLLLDLKGRVVEDLRVFVEAQSVRLIVAHGRGGPAAATLGRYAIMDDVTFTPLPGFVVEALLGPRAVERARAAGIAVPDAVATGPAYAHASVASPGGPLWVARMNGLGATGLWLGGAPETIAAAGAALGRAGVAQLAPDVAEAARVAAGDPKVGPEISEEYFPMELGLDFAIDYAKGCYLGQEPIVRIRDRGHVNWRLVGLRFDAAVLPSAGDRLESDAKPKAGRVTSAARLERPGEAALGVALAMLHVSIPIGAEVRVVGEAPGAAPIVARAVDARPAP